MRSKGESYECRQSRQGSMQTAAKISGVQEGNNL